MLNLPMKCFGSPVPASIVQRQYSVFVRLVWRFESVWRLLRNQLNENLFANGINTNRGILLVGYYPIR